MTKYIFITGGVVSSVGKGIATAVLGMLLQAKGHRVRCRKLDPYLNVDSGTMSPYQHGEVFVTEDGAETDLDLGHYERFTGVDARRSDSITAGRIYQRLIEKERRGAFLGATIQVIPHVTNEIKAAIRAQSDDADIMLCEIGGTVGDIEGQPFFEAIRQLKFELKPQDCLYIHLTLLPYLSCAGEPKTKPTQHSVRELRAIGIQPDILMVRSTQKLAAGERRKIALFCNIAAENVIEALDCATVRDVPLAYLEQGLDARVAEGLNLPDKKPDLAPWRSIVTRAARPDGVVDVGIVGKYAELKDAYISLEEALWHSGLANGVHVNCHWQAAEALEKDKESMRSFLVGKNALVLPGGFGERGSAGKIAAITHARLSGLPVLGICLGMQLMILEAYHEALARPEMGSREFEPSIDENNAAIDVMTRWVKTAGDSRITITRQQGIDSDKGGTMRLGAYPARLREGTLAHRIYGETRISERHRHRYEINRECEKDLAPLGFIFSGFSIDGHLPEILEKRDHPFFLGVQYHPELKSRPFAPHPVFVALMRAGLRHARML